MTFLEIKNLLSYIEANYNIYNSKSDNEINSITKTWAYALKDYNYNDVKKALADYICTSSLKPKPSHIIEQLKANSATKHFVHNQIMHTDGDGKPKILNHNTFMDIMKREYQPHLNMNICSLPQYVRDKLYAGRNSLNNFYDKIWGMIMSCSMTDLHLQLAINNQRGLDIVVDEFIKAIISATEIVDEFNDNEDIIKGNALSYIQHLNKVGKL